MLNEQSLLELAELGFKDLDNNWMKGKLPDGPAYVNKASTQWVKFIDKEDRIALYKENTGGTKSIYGDGRVIRTGSAIGDISEGKITPQDISVITKLKELDPDFKLSDGIEKTIGLKLKAVQEEKKELLKDGFKNIGDNWFKNISGDDGTIAYCNSENVRSDFITIHPEQKAISIANLATQELKAIRENNVFERSSEGGQATPSSVNAEDTAIVKHLMQLDPEFKLTDALKRELGLLPKGVDNKGAKEEIKIREVKK